MYTWNAWETTDVNISLGLSYISITCSNSHHLKSSSWSLLCFVLPSYEKKRMHC